MGRKARWEKEEEGMAKTAVRSWIRFYVKAVNRICMLTYTCV